jgi:hypothetical protein
VGERVDRPDTNRGTNPFRPPALTPIGEQIEVASLSRVRPGLHMAGQPHRVSCESTVPRTSPVAADQGHADHDHTRVEPVLADPRLTLARFGPRGAQPGSHWPATTPLCPELCIRIPTITTRLVFALSKYRNLVRHSAGGLSDSRRGSRPLLQARVDRREARDRAERSAPSSE